MSILIVEDEALFAMSLEDALLRAGYSVCGIADKWTEAIELADDHSPRVALVDIRIKGDMDGVETAQLLIKRYGVKALFMTGFVDEDIISRTISIDHLGLITKPVDIELLMSLIEQEGSESLAPQVGPRGGGAQSAL